jgi:hypothetical protein
MTPSEVRELRALVAVAYEAAVAARTTHAERELAARFKAAKDHPSGAPRYGNEAEIARLSAEIDRLWRERQPLRDQARETASAIVEWHELTALRTIDLGAMSIDALVALEAELLRRVDVDGPVELLRRTDPASHDRKGVACDAT